jgi:hypothetical protein
VPFSAMGFLSQHHCATPCSFLSCNLHKAKELEREPERELPESSLVVVTNFSHAALPVFRPKKSEVLFHGILA